jgi:carboxylesterase type B
LNVYVKSIVPEENLPVMMWIHGGAFSFGSGDDSFYAPDYLLRKDIVLVTINYRLGIFG